MQQLNQKIAIQVWVLNGEFQMKLKGKLMKILYNSQKQKKEDYKNLVFSDEYSYSTAKAEVFLREDINFLKQFEKLEKEKASVFNQSYRCDFSVESCYFELESSSFFLELGRVF